MRIFCINPVWADFWKRGDKYVAEPAGWRGRRSRNRGKRGPMFVKLSFTEDQNKATSKANPSNLRHPAICHPATCYPRGAAMHYIQGESGAKPGGRRAQTASWLTQATNRQPLGLGS